MFRYIFITNSYNYYNRIFGQSDKLEDYIGERGDIEEDFLYVEKSENLNFNKSDSINTSIVLGRSENPLYEKRVGTYLLYCESEEEVPYPPIVSRWFILDKTFIRKGQYELQLRRDVYADNIDACREAEAFIERGYVKDTNPIIYTQEPVPVNQIKYSETLLKDKTNSAWIVGYIIRDNTAEDGSSFEDVKKIDFSGTIANTTISSFEDWEFFKYHEHTFVEYSADTIINRTKKLYDYIKVSFYFNLKTGPAAQQGYYKATLYYDWNNGSPIYSSTTQFLGISRPDIDEHIVILENSVAQGMLKWYNNNTSKFWDGTGVTSGVFTGDLFLYDEADIETVSASTMNRLQALNNTVLYNIDKGLYYDVYITNFVFSGFSGPLLENVSGDFLLGTLVYDIFTDYSYALEYGNGKTNFELETRFVSHLLGLSETKAVGNFTVEIPDSDARTNISDQPFDMFLIPYSFKENFICFNNTISFVSDKNFAMQLAAAIGARLGNFVIDIQLLPYCPISDSSLYDYEENGKIIHAIPTQYINTIVYSVPDDGPYQKAYSLIWASSNNKNFKISLSLKAQNKKIENQCSMYRLVSSNYNATYEFNLAKNAGSLDYINIDLTYLPYSSYIHLNPAFNGLYGSDFEDARGLISQGDFSIMYLSNKWAEYIISNKNYLTIFNRDIENMDVNRKYEVAGQTIDLAASAISGVANAASSALSSGSGTGAALSLLSGVVSTAANTAQSSAKMQLGELAYQENRAYKKDIYSLNLQNVKALPASIAKTTAYTYNNKIFPILEYYTCTEEEKRLFAKYIEKRGMTVGTIGKIQDYLNDWENPYETGTALSGYIYPKYIKAQIIKIDVNDYLTADTIASEFARGFYIED